MNKSKIDQFWDVWGVEFMMRMPNTPYLMTKFNHKIWSLDFIPKTKL